MNGWLIALVVAAVISTAGGVGWSRLSKEHRQARSLPLDIVDFGKLNGAIDDLRIYIGALSTAEIQALYSAGTGP